VSRFVTQRVVVRVGVAGSGHIGGEADASSDIGDAVLHAYGGALLYFTPQSMLSLYSGAEYWTPPVHRPDKDTGTIVGLLGVQGAVSSRASVFLEGGYGFRLTKGDDDEHVTRAVARIGVRLKF
jgi:hypothetical protein